MNKADVVKIIKKYDKYFVDINEFKLKVKNSFVDKCYDEGLRSDNIIAIHNESSLFRTEGVVVSTLGIHCTYSDFVKFEGLVGVEKYLTSRLYLKYANKKDKIVYICPNGQQEMMFDILQSVVKSKGIQVKKTIEVNNHNIKDIYEQAKKYYKKRKYKDAYECFYACAIKGHDMSQYYLGEMYEEGFGVKADNKTALEWYEKSAKQNNALGALYGAEIIRSEQYSDKYKDAMKYYELAAAQNQTLAFKRLASLYLFGKMCEVNVRAAVFYAQKAIERGDNDCKVYLAMGYMKDSTYGTKAEAYELLYERASQHHDYAKYLIAFYASSKQFDLDKEDYEKIVRWAHDVENDYNVEEVIDDLNKIINEFIKVENRIKREQEAREHISFLDKMFNDAKEFEMNYNHERALKIYEMLILEGYEDANYSAARLYWNLGTQSDRAIKLLLDVALIEHIDSIKMLADIVNNKEYEFDLDDIRNLRDVCKQCITDGHNELQGCVSVFVDYIYEKENLHICDDQRDAFMLFDDKEYDKAFPLLLKMADDFHFLACEYVGRCYQKGLGTRKNTRLAKAYYEQSSTDNSKVYLVEMILERHNKRLAYQKFIELISQGNTLALKMFIDCLLEHQYELYDEKGRRIVEEYMGSETRTYVINQLKAELDKRFIVSETEFKEGMTLCGYNREESKIKFMIAAKNNHKEAMLQLYVMFNEDGKYETADEWYEKYDHLSLLPLPKEGKIISSKCNQCGKCQKACPGEVIQMNYLGVMSIDNKGCLGCDMCIQECNVHAIKIIKDGKIQKT